MKLRHYQTDAVDRTLSWINAQHCNPLIVMPTASGKSLVIAETCRRILEQHEDNRIIVATHVRELVEQNYDEILRWWPQAPLGICCAGMERVDYEPRLIVGTVQTMQTRAWAFQRATHIIVDEAHLIPRRARSRYQKLFREVRGKRKVPILGFTATPYRLDSGLLHRGNDALFDIIAANVPVSQCVRERWLAPLQNRRGSVQIDTARMLHYGTGDFSVASMDQEVTRQRVTARALDEAIALGANRKSWLVFSVSIRHGETIQQHLAERGISSMLLTHKLTKVERDSVIEDFRAGKIRVLISVNIVTIGFNVPRIDMLVILRPTLSTALYVQMLGRGMRLFAEKDDCLVLDFGGNIDRHGPINQPRVRTQSPIFQEAGERPPKTKCCPECDADQAVFARTCNACGYLFSHVLPTADTLNPVLDLDIDEPSAQRTPAEVVRDYMRAQRFEEDPFASHLANLRVSE